MSKSCMRFTQGIYNKTLRYDVFSWSNDYGIENPYLKSNSRFSGLKHIFCALNNSPFKCK